MVYTRNKVLSFMTKYKILIQKQPNLSLVFLVFHCSYVSKMVKSFWNFFYWKGLWECFLSHFLILWLIISFYAHSKTPSYDSNSFFMMDINYRECVFFFVHEFEGWDILHKKCQRSWHSIITSLTQSCLWKPEGALKLSQIRFHKMGV